jgi:superfamily I DNA/RNA helicase
MKPLEKAMDDHGIPCQVVGSIPFFKEQPAALMLDLLKAVYTEHYVFLEERLAKDGVAEAKIDRLRALVRDKDAAGALALLAEEAGLPGDDRSSRQITRLLDLAQETRLSPPEFCRMCTLGTAGDGFDSGADRVALITLHAAKGLEFSCVFIAGCEDGLLPYTLTATAADPEEERRLLYVGMTRAKEMLMLSYAKKRRLFGRQLALPRSPFLDAIEEALVEASAAQMPRRREDDQLRLF